jgi:Uma2 family endonuclease
MRISRRPTGTSSARPCKRDRLIVSHAKIVIISLGVRSSGQRITACGVEVAGRPDYNQANKEQAMAQTSSVIETTPVGWTINLKSIKLTDEQFHQVCLDNPELPLELTAQGVLIVMPPTGLPTGIRNSRLTRRLDEWAEQDGTGLAFDSSTLFTLPNGAKRSPDASWIKRERYDQLSEKEKEGFSPICPDFVIELRSRTDRLTTLQEKMAEYIENGAQLGWLIDPINKRVFIYRPDQPVECLDQPDSLSGESVLIGFNLNLLEIW